VGGVTMLLINSLVLLK